MFRSLRSLLAAACAVCGAAAALTPQQVVVVYNAGSVRSSEAARHYAELRHIPMEQLVPLQELQPDAQVISRRDYEAKVVDPLLRAARENGWQWPAAPQGGKRMQAMVLMPDLPLKIKEQVNRPIPKHPDGRPDYRVRPPHDAAAVDSELALLGSTHALEGALANPYFKKDAPLDKANLPVMAVCRIEGVDEATITRMIEDPVRVEKKGLWGWTVVDEGGPIAQGDAQFKAVAALAAKAGQPLFHESSKETLASCFPLMPQTAVYFGWYTERANGPFAPAAPDTFRFAPGAVAAHLHSFSCTNVKDPKRWAPALLARGAAVTTGNVDEPLLTGCLDLGVFYDRLLKGYTVAEAGYMAMPALSWQAIILGDPLYRPYAVMKAGKGDTQNPFVAWARMLKAANGATAKVEEAVKRQLSGKGAALYAELYAWDCTNRSNLFQAADYFRMAANASAAPQDKLRNKLMQISVLHAAKDTRTASELMHQCLQDYEGSAYFPAVEKTAATVLKAEGWKPKPKPKPAAPAQPADKPAPKPADKPAAKPAAKPAK